jgi:Helix-turn-helix domain
VKLLTTKAVADQLNISPVTVLRLHDQGLLRGVVITESEQKRTIRFRPETLEKFITSREQEAGK